MQSIKAQTCGTRIPKDYYTQVVKPLKLAVSEEPISFTKLPNVSLSITAYSFMGSYTIDVLQESIVALNEAFKPAGISFTICKAEGFSETEFYVIKDNKAENKLTSRYHSAGTINLYLTGSLVIDGDIVCGYAYLPSLMPMDFIFISSMSGCNITSTLIHEMGHFFGLLHPHDADFGTELVDGSNCETAGDLICDTEASPNLLGLISGDCHYTGNYQDDNHEYYLPTVTNYMSYSTPECRCKFTQGQYNRMIEFYWSHLQHLR